MKNFIFFSCILSCFLIYSQDNIDKNIFYKKIDTLTIALQQNNISKANGISKEIQKNIVLFDTTTKLDILYKLSLSYIHFGFNDEAKNIVLKAIPDIKRSNNNELNGKLYKQLCYIGIIEYDIPSATKYYELSKKHFGKTTNSNLQFNLDLLIYKMYLYLKKYDTAIQISNACYLKSLQLKDSTKSINALAALIDCYKATKDYKNVLTYSRKGVEISATNYINSHSYFLEEQASVYINLKQYDSAKLFFKKAYNAVSKDTTLFHDFKAWRVNKIGAELYAIVKDKEKSLKYLGQSDQYKFENNLKEKSEYLFFKAGIYEKLDDLDLALANLKLYLNLKEEIDKKEAQKYLIKYASLHESIEKEKKINSLTKENHEKEVLIYTSDLKRKFVLFYFSMVFIFTLLSLFIWYNFKTKKMISKSENLRFQSIIEAQEKERIRIAKDLHDGLGQNICAIKMICSNSLDLEDKSNLKLLNIIDETYEEIRNISHNMMPNILLNKGLIPAIQEMVANINDSSTIQFDFEYDFPNKIEESVSISIYRILQESISNIIKHSQASTVKIKLGIEKKNHVLVIKDDGIGSKDLCMATLINTSENKSQKLGIGLKNILSRTTMIKGSIYIDSSPKQGTSLKIFF
ncbi:tetratricopeptide repeat-containing sensor histidine kinase [Flavobacterium sp. HNIBRBA15423]|uniref:tetratricopeptide repeat-containing sensor histidine kinase n=1 Tax=Flavobacterium sp. HNIBRBA15423 TaxID=3458683 RepID=UPI004044CB58